MLYPPCLTILILSSLGTARSHGREHLSPSLAGRQYLRIDAQGTARPRHGGTPERISMMREDMGTRQGSQQAPGLPSDSVVTLRHLSHGDQQKGILGAPSKEKPAGAAHAEQPLPEPTNFVINCPEDVNRLARFRRHMEKAGLTFEVFPCVKLTHETLNAAIHEGYFGPLAARGDLRFTGALGVALAHMKLLRLIVSRNIPAANIFEDDEVVFDNYHSERHRILASLPGDAEFVNLNPLDPRGEPVPGADTRLLKMTPGIPRWSSIWLSNYFVSHEGARKLLNVMRRFDLGSSGDEQIDWYVVDVISSGCSVCRVNAYTYATNILSMHCQNVSEKEKLDRKAMSLVSRDPVDPMCWEGDPEGLR